MNGRNGAKMISFRHIVSMPCQQDRPKHWPRREKLINRVHDAKTLTQFVYARIQKTWHHFSFSLYFLFRLTCLCENLRKPLGCFGECRWPRRHRKISMNRKVYIRWYETVLIDPRRWNCAPPQHGNKTITIKRIISNYPFKICSAWMGNVFASAWYICTSLTDSGELSPDIAPLFFTIYPGERTNMGHGVEWK